MGVVGDLRRDMEGHHYAEKCSVFGLSQEELEVIQRLVSPHFQGCLMPDLGSDAGCLVSHK